MAVLSITARFPMGTYLGHQGAGQRSELPDPVRLHAALMHAAGKGSTAIEVNDDLRPSPAAIQALAWLEEHPPTALQIPSRRPLVGHSPRSWRDEGVLEGVGSRRKVMKEQSSAMALAGSLGWAWDEEVPEEGVETLERICEDVSCLGEADSPVVLEIAPIDPTHIGGGATNSFM